MLDLSWGEVLLIGAVALIVIGPKDLPKALRTLGQITTKLRRMAGEFRSQFNEAVREAELDEIRREVDGVRSTAEDFRPSFNPVETIRNELKNAVETRDETRSATDPLAGTAPSAIARAEPGATRELLQGGSYDVPRPVEPPPEGGAAAGPADRAP